MTLQALLAQLPPPRRAPRLRRDVQSEIVVLAAIMRGHPVRVAAIAAGVSESGVRSWIRRDALFAQKYRAAAREGREAYVESRRAQLIGSLQG
jgi:hypothetical protein